MMCCNQCPFHPVLGSEAKKCQNPVCNYSAHNNDLCSESLGQRCMLDAWIIERLYQNDPLAVSLAITSLKTALKGRDRALLISLFQAADETLRIKFWQWLEKNEPRSLWLLNPIFVATGLPPVNSIAGVVAEKTAYMDAIIANPYSGRNYRTLWPVLKSN